MERTQLVNKTSTSCYWTVSFGVNCEASVLSDRLTLTIFCYNYYSLCSLTIIIDCCNGVLLLILHSI